LPDHISVGENVIRKSLFTLGGFNETYIAIEPCVALGAHRLWRSHGAG
jgi:hypothetical protein